ncbi:MAG: diacylglycerol kinase, partial [Neofamilia sp.]
MKRDYKQNFLLNLIDSFNYAINGLITAVGTERNIKIHYGTAIIVLFSSLFFDLSRVEYMILII